MKNVGLWALALLIMISAVIYQRSTGPTYPYKGFLEAGGKHLRYKLIRSEETIKDAEVILPDLGTENFNATLHFKRYKTADSITVKAFQKTDNQWVATLPKQPAAGKLEYFISASFDGKTVRIPEQVDEQIILRYKDPVPGFILWPHIIMMFFSVLIGMRSGLSALFQPESMRKWGFIALIGMTLGGMILGPIVQKYAFGAYWTGFPFGGDLTDNKMLIMWASWLFAAAVMGTKTKKNELINRVVVGLAAIVMTVVYLIPHSMSGSELDYAKLDQGIDAKQAIGTGD